MTQPYTTHKEIKNFAEKKVNLPSEYAKKYRERIKKLRDDLAVYIGKNPDYDLVKMFHSGSLAKGTALKNINDLDVAIYIKKSESLAEGTKLLEWLKERLKEVYPTIKDEQIKIPPGSHCVAIEFKSEGIPNIDIVPVIYEGDKDNFGYLTTKTTGERILTSIPLHLDFINKRKEANKVHYAQVVRLLKWWIKEIKNNDEDFKFKSLMAELLCSKLADDGLDLSNYVIFLEQVFKFIVQGELKEKIFFTDYYKEDELPKDSKDVMRFYDPVNPDNNVAKKYTNENKNKLIEYSWDALDAIHEAHHATTQEKSINLWQKIFGPTFNINL